MFRLVTLLALSIAFSSASAQTQKQTQSPECDCAGPDKLAPKDKAFTNRCSKYEPQKAQKDCFANGSTCGLPWGPVSDTAQSGFQSLIYKNPVSPVKTYEETLDYISCYRSTTTFSIKSKDEQFCHFKKTLAPYIKLAAESAKMNPSIFACLIKRESEFDAKAESDFYVWQTVGGVKKKVLKHAYSYPQFTDETLGYIKRIIEQPLSYTQGRLTDAVAAVNDLQGKIDELMKKPVKARIGLSKLKNQLKISAKYAHDLRASAKAAEVWARYWDGSKAIPKTVDLKSLSCPKIAFAVSAAKQMFDLYSIFDESTLVETETTIRAVPLKVATKNKDGTPIHPQDQEAQQLYDTTLYIAGAYNQGAGGFAADCKARNGVASCIRQGKLKEHALPTETINHLISINNCAKAGSDEPMNGTDKMKNCQDFKCSS